MYIMFSVVYFFLLDVDCCYFTVVWFISFYLFD